MKWTAYRMSPSPGDSCSQASPRTDTVRRPPPNRAQRRGPPIRRPAMVTFIEISKSEHQHGGAGWEFGKCLWSPTRNKIGSDRYSIMRVPEVGDQVIHVYHTENAGRTDRYIIGRSEVNRKVR